MLKKILLLALLPAIAFAREFSTPVEVIEKQGITIIKTFDAPRGIKGYLGKYQDMGVTIYPTPDGKHAISSYVYNEKDENLSNTLIEKEIYAPAGREMWRRMEQSHWLLDGKRDAPVIVYILADPFYPYCRQLWQQARPQVDSGKVQLRTLLIGIVKPKSPATTAAILASKDPAKAWQQYEASGDKLRLDVPANVSTEQMRVLGDNERLMDNLGTNITPAVYHMSKESTLQRTVGLPDQGTLNTIVENK